MDNSISSTDTITLRELAEILNFSSSVLSYHNSVGNLPEPINKDNRLIGQETIFNKTEVAKQLGLDNLDEKLLDFDGAAKLLGISAYAVRLLITDKYLPLPYFKLNYHSTGASFRFRKSELEEYLEKHKAMGITFTSNKEHTRGNYFKLNFVLEIFALVLNNSRLSDREAEVMRALMIENEGFQEVADRFGLSREMIRQIFIKAMNRLRQQVGAKALEKAEQNLDKQIQANQNLLAQYQVLRQELADLGYQVDLSEETETTKISEPLPIEELELSVRTRNCLRAAKIKDLNELTFLKEDDMLKFRNFGQKSLKEIKKFMAHHCLRFSHK